MEAIGQLAAGVAHDLNNALGAVVGSEAAMVTAIHSRYLVAASKGQRYVIDQDIGTRAKCLLVHQLQARLLANQVRQVPAHVV